MEKLTKNETIICFNINYNKLKNFISKTYGKNHELLELFRVIEFYSSAVMDKDEFNIDLNEESMISAIVPDLVGVNEIKEMLKNGDQNLFINLPTEKFENSALYGCNTIIPWKNILKYDTSSKFVIDTIIAYFQLFVKLYEMHLGDEKNKDEKKYKKNEDNKNKKNEDNKNKK